MDLLLTNMTGLLVVAVLVALVARRLALPYTVGLVIAGVAIVISGVGAELPLTHDFIFDVILPPLLFEAAINIHWRELYRDAAPVLVLAVFGTVISAATVAAGMAYGLGWPAAPAVLFGVLIAATDPVAVIAMFKDSKVEGRLRLLVESESLLNDGVAAVLFGLVLVWAEHGVTETPAAIGLALLISAGGGIIAGLAVAIGVIGIAGRTSDHLVESTMTAIGAYGSFLLAERFHCSGVLATVAAGLVIGNAGPRGISEQARSFMIDLWEFVAFVANSVIFLLIGMSVGDVTFERVGLGSILAVIGFVLLGRALTVYPLCAGFRWSRRAIPLPMQHVLWWGGLRGALALALALSLPASLPYHREILILTFAVVVFSVVGQGLTMTRLLRRFGFLR